MLITYDNFGDAIDIIAIHNGDGRLTRAQSAHLKLLKQTTGDIPGSIRPTFKAPDADEVRWAEGILGIPWVSFLTVHYAVRKSFPVKDLEEDPKTYFMRLKTEAETNDKFWKSGLRMGAVFTPAPWITGSLVLENGIKIGPGHLLAHNLPNAEQVHIEAFYKFTQQTTQTRYVIYPRVVRRSNGSLEINQNGKLSSETVRLARWLIFDGWVNGPTRRRRQNGPNDPEDDAGGAAPNPM
jgi:hypothetical protein